MISQAFGWLWTILAQDLRERYPRRAAILGEVASVGLSLVVYWYTSRALESGGVGLASSGWPGSYFSFLVLNEAALLLPLATLQMLPNWLREAKASGVLEAALLLPGSQMGNLLRLSTPAMSGPLARAVVFFVIGVAAAGFSILPAPAVAWWRVVLASLPCFGGLSLLCGGLWLSTQRGLGVLPILVAALAVMGGAYFPKSLLPDGVRAISDGGSPITWVLEATRAALAGAPGGTNWIQNLVLAAFVFIPLGAWMFRRGLRQVRARGSLEILNPA